MSQIALHGPIGYSAPRRPLQLTRRGRLLLVALPLLVLFAVCTFLIGSVLQPAHAATDSSATGSTQLVTVTVNDGETLWGLAHEYAPSQDAGDVVAQIEDLNSLHGPLRAGATLTVPADAEIAAQHQMAGSHGDAKPAPAPASRG